MLNMLYVLKDGLTSKEMNSPSCWADRLMTVHSTASRVQIISYNPPSSRDADARCTGHVAYDAARISGNFSLKILDVFELPLSIQGEWKKIRVKVKCK